MSCTQDFIFLKYFWGGAIFFCWLQVCAAEFPGYVMNSIDGYLEESHESTVLHVIKSFMTSVRYPPASLLCTVIDQLQVSKKL